MAEGSCALSCEVTCETGYETVCDFDLYELFPWITRYLDAMSSGSIDAEGILDKITYALEQEFCITEREIRQLATLLDADAMSPDFLLYLSATLGTMVGTQSALVGGLDFQRWMVKNLVAFYKIKGTHPSWSKRFSHYFQDGTLAFLYQAWELWKEIPYEVGNYSRYQDYTHTLRAARFDLYHLVGGVPVFLDPSDAEPLVPYIEPVRPIHVLLRHNVIRFQVSDALSVASETMELTVQELEPELPDPFVDEIGVTLECASTCETGSCEGYCELTCEGAACEQSCQAACTTGSETDPVPCDLDCKSACEGGACEASCQLGSCQSGCQSASEIDKWPCHIEGAKNYLDPGGHDSGATIYGRVWYPYEGMNFGATLPATDPWWVTFPGTGSGKNTQFQLLYYDKVGDGHFHYETGGGIFTAGTLIPALQYCDWVEVHCIKGGEDTSVHAQEGNGVLENWQGHILFHPHPGSIRFEATLERLEEAIVAGGAEGTNTVTVTDASDYNIHDAVQLRDANHAETNTVAGIVGNTLSLKCPLESTFLTGAGTAVIRPEWKMVAHTEVMETPTGATAISPWWGKLNGDVDDTTVNQANYRPDVAPPAPGIYLYDLTWKEAPKNGATITVYFIKESDCKYYIEQTFQSIDGDTLTTQKPSTLTGALTFKPGAVDNHIWVWDAATDKWLQEAAPSGGATTGAMATYAGDPTGAAPAGWLWCDGTAYAQAAYAALYAVCGSRFDETPPGAGNFRVPNIEGRYVVGYDVGDNDYDVPGYAANTNVWTGFSWHGQTENNHNDHDLVHDHGPCNCVLAGVDGAATAWDGSAVSTYETYRGSDNLPSWEKPVWSATHFLAKHKGPYNTNADTDNRPVSIVLPWIIKT